MPARPGLWWTLPVHCLLSMTNTPVGPITRWMLLICERDCSSTETKRSWLVLRWWLGVADRAGVKVERPERGGDADLDAGEGGHRMQQRRTSLGGTGDLKPASSTRVPSHRRAKIDCFEHLWQPSRREAAPLCYRQPHLRARGNSAVEGDHGRLKSRLQPMRDLKQDQIARVVVVGHAFVQNVRRGMMS